MVTEVSLRAVFPPTTGQLGLVYIQFRESQKQHKKPFMAVEV